MFTGIVEAQGTLQASEDHETTRRFVIDAGLSDQLSLGDSVAVDGACLTVADLLPGAFAVDLIGTTLERTIAGGYAPGARLNLERAMKLGARLDGHLVQGHVDGVGRLERVRQDGEFWRMDVRIPKDVAQTTILHGSITLNGVSLTVSDFVDDDVIQIGIIPFTWEHTNLGSLKAGSPLNVEGDLIGKYVGKIVSSRHA